MTTQQKDVQYKITKQKFLEGKILNFFASQETATNFPQNRQNINVLPPISNKDLKWI